MSASFEVAEVAQTSGRVRVAPEFYANSATRPHSRKRLIFQERRELRESSSLRLTRFFIESPSLFQLKP
jgi:hypothetical protein